MKSLSAKFGAILICIWLLFSYRYLNAEDSSHWGHVKIAGKCGFKDSKGKIMIKPQFDDCLFFSEGLGAVKIGSKWGYIDETGKVAIGPKFDEPSSFFDGLAIAKIAGKCGYIDATGNYVIEPKFDDASGWFSEGLAHVKVGENWGYIDKAGNSTIEPKFDGATFFSQGLAAVMINNKWGYIDKTGKYIIESKFDGASKFSLLENLASVKVGDRWGFINKKGDIVIDPKFDGTFGPTFFYGKARVNINTIDGGRDIDVSGQVITTDWRYCCQGNNETPFVYYNTKNMSYPSKNIVRVWSKWVEIGKAHNMRLDEIDCLNKTVKNLNLTSYGRDGKVTYSDSKSPEKSESNYIVPNSLMEALSETVCSQKSK